MNTRGRPQAESHVGAHCGQPHPRDVVRSSASDSSVRCERHRLGVLSSGGQRAKSFSEETFDRFADTRRGQGWEGGAASLGANRWCVWGAGGPVMGKSQYHKATNWLGFFSEIDKAS